MEILKLKYLNFYENDNNEMYFLGYFSTIVNVNLAIEKYSKMAGFRDNTSGFEITELEVSLNNYTEVVYDVMVYYHNQEYTIEHFHCLGIFTDGIRAKEVLAYYEENNKGRLVHGDVIYESFINNHKLDVFNLSEGFVSS